MDNHYYLLTMSHCREKVERCYSDHAPCLSCYLFGSDNSTNLFSVEWAIILNKWNFFGGEAEYTCRPLDATDRLRGLLSAAGQKVDLLKQLDQHLLQTVKVEHDLFPEQLML